MSQFNQEGRLLAYLEAAGLSATANATYDEAVILANAAMGGTQVERQGAEIEMYQAALTSTTSDINALRAEMAAAAGVSTFDQIGYAEMAALLVTGPDSNVWFALNPYTLEDQAGTYSGGTFARASTKFGTKYDRTLTEMASGQHTVWRGDWSGTAWSRNASAATEDHFGVTCDTDAGLLMSTARTNLLPYTDDLTGGSWVSGTATITANSTTAPDGTTTASKVENCPTSSGPRYALTGTANARQHVGFWLKRISTTGTLILKDTAGTGQMSIDLSVVGDDWIYITHRTEGIVNVNNLQADASGNTGPEFLASSGTVDFYVWGITWIDGTTDASETITIPASGAPVSRLADTLSYTGAGALPSAGTLIMSVSFPYSTSYDQANLKLFGVTGSGENLDITYDADGMILAGSSSTNGAINSVSIGTGGQFNCAREERLAIAFRWGGGVAQLGIKKEYDSGAWQWATEDTWNDAALGDTLHFFRQPGSQFPDTVYHYALLLNETLTTAAIEVEFA